MKPEDISGKKVLISPLDWGMGHTTRCIPIIRQLLEQNNEVIFAGNNLQQSLIKQDFSSLHLVDIEGYNIKLDSSKPTYFQMILQVSKFSKAIKKEKNAVEELVEEYNIDVVISDNRYGFRSDQSKNIIMTHQLSPAVPTMRKILTKQLIKHIEQFDYCWIPDDEQNSLTADLNQVELSIPKIHIGWLSRFKKSDITTKYKYLGIVSGPEPERSRFARQLKSKLRNEEHLIVLPQSIDGLYENIEINPSTRRLEELINSSDIVVSRAGYTTIMELKKLNKQAILIPTKGQYEQIYLSKKIVNPNFIFLSENKYFK